MSGYRQPPAGDLICVERLSYATAQSHPGFAFILECHAIWAALPRVEGVPARHAVRRALFGRVLPFMAWVKVLDDGTDFQWQALGALQKNHFGVDVTGMRMSDVTTRPVAETPLGRAYTDVLQQRDAAFFTAGYEREGDVFRWVAMILPLVDRSGTITDCLGVTKSTNREERTDMGPN